MDFALISEAYLRPGEDEHDRYPQVMAEFVAGERAGFDVVGLSEQHFNHPMYTFASAEPFYGALAANTSRIGIRTMSMILPYHHPLNVAERMATLDIVSGGRLQFGTGRGNSAYSLEAYGLSPADTQAIWREQMEIIIGCWQEGSFAYEGTHYRIPERAVRPKPVQQPHPPLWYAAISPNSHVVAAEEGLSVMTQTIGIRRDQVDQRVQAYRSAFRHDGGLSRAPAERVSLYTMAYCHEDRSVARERARQPMTEYLLRTSEMYEATMRAQGLDLDFDKLRRGFEDWDRVVGDGMVMVGDPDDCVRWLREYAELGIDEFCFRIEGVSHDHALECIEALGAHVIPQCKAPAVRA